LKKLLITCLILFPNIALGATKYTKESSEYAIRYVFGDKAETFIKIAHCESGLNNLAINKKSQDNRPSILGIITSKWTTWTG
jgi:hypothetical protein